MAALHFKGRSRSSKKPWPPPWYWWPLGWFRAKRRCRNKPPKGTCRFSPWARKILDLRTNQNPGMEFGPTPTHVSRNGLSFYGGLERLDQQPDRPLLSRANHQPPPPFGKIKLCLTLKTEPFPFSQNLSLSKPKRRRFIRHRIFRLKPSLLVWSPLIDLNCQKIKKTFFHLKNRRKYPNFERSSR